MPALSASARRRGTAFLAASIALSSVSAQLVEPPLAIDPFPSRATLTFTLLPLWTGLPGPVEETLLLLGPTVVHREMDPTNDPGERDTIDTEIVSMELTGSGLGFPVEVRVGADNGVLPGLEASRGQIRDLDSAPEDEAIDYPADRFFDICFEIWIDLDQNNFPDVGEVVRNRDEALRMAQPLLDAVPPPPGTDYEGFFLVSKSDPGIGTADALPFVGTELLLYGVNLDGTISDAAHALLRVDVPGLHIHQVIPEPSVLGPLGVACLGLLCLTRRRRIP